MKIAEVHYNGRTRNKETTTPHGERYSFAGGSAVVESIADARWFEDEFAYDVEWTGRGRIVEEFADDAADAREAVENIGYQTKRKLVNQFDLETESQEEDVLEEALEPVAEEVQEIMENQG